MKRIRLFWLMLMLLVSTAFTPVMADEATTTFTYTPGSGGGSGGGNNPTSDKVTIRFDLSDSYGDGWNGNSISVVNSNTNEEVATLTISDGDYENESLQLDAGVTYNFVWYSGSDCNETSFAILDADYNELYSHESGDSDCLEDGEVFYSYTPVLAKPSVYVGYMQFDLSDSAPYTATLSSITKNGYQGQYHSSASCPESLTIPSTVTYNDTEYTVCGITATFGGTFFQSITLPEDLVSIGSSNIAPFAGCQALTSITIPASVTNIYAGSFNNISTLTTVTFEGSIPPIISGVVFDGTGITTVNVPSGSVTAYQSALSSSGLPSGTTVQVPGRTKVGQNQVIDNFVYEFYSNSNAAPSNTATIIACTVGGCAMPEIPSTVDNEGITYTVTEIVNGAMNGSGSRWTNTSLTLPNTITTIGNSVFANSTTLTSVTIPASVTIIGSSAFSGCSAVTEVTFEGTTPPGWADNYQTSPDVFHQPNPGEFNSNTGNTIFYVPASAVQTYKTAYPAWASYIQAIPQPTIDVGYFRYTLDLSNHTAVLSAYSSAYDGELHSPNGPFDLVLPNTVTYNNEQYTVTGIDHSIASTNLSSITLPESLTTIGPASLAGNSTLTSITIPASVTTIGANAFASCSAMTSVVFEGTTPPVWGDVYNSMSQPNPGEFKLNMGNTIFYVPASAVQAYQEAYPAWSSYIQASAPVLDPNNHVVGDFTFIIDTANGTAKVKATTITSGEMVIPSTVEYDGDTYTVTSFASTSEIQGAPFCYNATGITSLTLPSNLEKIDNAVFMGCTGLTSLTIPASVTSIESGSFSGCSNLTAVTFEGTNPPTFYDSSSANTAAFATASNTILYVPTSAVNAYNTDYPSWAGIIFAAGTQAQYPNNFVDGDFTYAVDTKTQTATVKATSLTSGAMTIPASVVYNGITCTVNAIADNAFQGKNGITAVTIPESMTNIGSGAFNGCSGVTLVIFEGTTPPTWADGTVGNEFATAASGNTLLIVPTSAVQAYQEAYTAWASNIHAAGGSHQSGTLTVYDGTITSQTIPAYVYYFDAYTRSQYVIPAADLAEMDGGSINALTYYLSQSENYTTDVNVDVYLKEVPSTTISSFVDKSTATIVYQGPLTFADNQLTINFTTSYDYKGGNLMIGIENTTIGEYKSYSFSGQTVSGASVNGYNYDGLSNVGAGQQNFIPKTTFDYEIGGVAKPKNFAASEVGVNSATLSWDPVTNADSYELYYSTTDATPATYVNGVISVNDTSHTLTGLTTKTTYYAYVRTVIGTEKSDWSNVCEFTPSVGTPENLVASNVTATSATLSWDAVTNADSYELYYSTTDATPANNVTGVISVNDTSHALTDLATGTTLYAFVRTVIGTEKSDWSNVCEFTPYLVRTENLTASKVAATSARLSWNAVADAEGYELSYSTTEGAPNNGTIVTELTKTHYKLIGLEDGTTYYAYVRAKRGDAYSEWSDVCQFTPTSSTLITINKDVTGTSYAFPFPAMQDSYRYGQFIIPKTMLADLAGREINKLIFYGTQTEDVSWGDAKFDVYLDETSNSAYSWDNSMNAYDHTNFTKVFSNGSLSLVNGQMIIEFSDHFVYNGTDNLLVEIREIVKGSRGRVDWYFDASGLSGINCLNFYNTGNANALASSGRGTGVPKMSFGFEPVTETEIQQDGFTLQMNDDEDAFVVTAYDDSSTTPTVPSVVNYEGQDYPVTGIAANALKDHASITKITIPSSITEIQADAFAGCTGMEYVYLESTTPPTWDDANTGSEFNTPEGTVLIVPAAAVGAYKSAYPAWSSCIFSEIPNKDGVFFYSLDGSEATIIGYCGSASELTIPATATINNQTYQVTAIADGVFTGKTEIAIVNFEATTLPAWPDGAVGHEFGTTSYTYIFVPAESAESYKTAYPAWANNIMTRSQSIEVGDFTYIINGNIAMISGYTGTATEVTIPATVSTGSNNYNVKIISGGVFTDNTNVTKVFFMSSNPPTWPDGTVGSEFGGTSNTKIYVSPDALASYKARYTAWDAASAIESTDALYNFTFNSGTMTATVTGIKESNPKNLLIPATAKNPDDGLTYTVTTIGGSAFRGKSTVTKLVIPSTVTTINDQAFWGCSGLTEVTIPASVTNISADAFYNCSGVGKVYFEGVNPPTWGDGTQGDDFTRAQGGTKLYVPAESLEQYKAAYTAWANYIYGGVVIAEETVTIGKLTYKLYSYSDGRHTATVTDESFSPGEIGTVPSTVEHDGVTYTVTALGNEAFSGTRAMTVNLPETLTGIGESCFSGTDITTITIPSNVESMGKWAIFNAYQLKTICFKSTTPPTYAKYNNNASYNTNLSALEKIYVPVGCADAYKEAFPLWASKIVEGTVPLMASVDHFKFELIPGENGGENTATLIGIDSEIQNDDLVIPNTVTVDGVEYKVRTIGDGENAIFYSNQKVTIPENVTTIASKAFYNCGTTSGIREVVFAGNSQLTTIGESAFEGCNYLNKITIPENVVTIGDAAFKNCFNINDFAIASNKLKTIGAEAFYSAGNLDNFKLILPASLETVGDNAFHNFKTRYVMFKGAVPPTYGTTMTENDYNSEFLSGFEIVVLEDDLATYQNAPTPWGDYWFGKIRALTLAEIPFNGPVYINDVEYVGPYYRGVDDGKVMFYTDELPAAGDVRIPKSFVCPDDNETYQVTVLGKVPAGATSVDVSDNNYLTTLLDKDVFRECRHQLKSVNFANCTSLTLDNFSAPANEGDYSVLNTSDNEFGIVGNSDSWSIDEIDVTDSLIYWKSYTDNGLGGHGVWTTTKEEYDDAAIVAVTAEGDTIYDPRRYEEGYWFYRWNYKWYVTNYRIHHFYHNVSEADRNWHKSTYQERGFEEYEEWMTGPVALESVDFSGCTSLTHVPGGFLQHNPKLRYVSFKGCTNLSTVGNCVMAYCDSLKVIDFSGCTSLTENSFPIEYEGNASSSLTDYIGKTYPWLTGWGASQNKRMQKVDFSGCTGFTTIPNGLFFCKADTVLFDGCTGLVSIEKDTEFEEVKSSNVYGVNAFGNSGNAPAHLSFKDCTSLTTIGRSYFEMDQEGNDLKSVDFSGCTNLQKFDAYAFNYRTHLESVNLEGCTNLEVIGDMAFQMCLSLREFDLTVSEKLRYIGNNAFCAWNTRDYGHLSYSDCPEFMPLEAIDIRGTNLYIGKQAFLYCNTRLVNLREGVVMIDDRAFSYMHNLEHINLPNTTLKRIGEGFMYASPKLQSLIIPASVDSIGGAFLWGCGGLRNVYLLGKPAALRSNSDGNYQLSFYGGEAHLVNLESQSSTGKIFEPVHDCTFWVASPYQYCQYVLRNFDGDEHYQYDCSDDAILRMGAWEYPSPTDPLIGTMYQNVDNRLEDDKFAWRQLDRRYTISTARAQTEYEAFGFNVRQYNNRYNDWHLDPDTDNVNIIHTPFTVPDKRKLSANKWATICFPFAGDADYQQYLRDLYNNAGYDNVSEESVIIAKYVKAEQRQTYEDGLYHLTFQRVHFNELRSNYPYVIYSPIDVTIDMLHGKQMTNAHWTADISETWEVSNEPGTYVTMIGNYINPMYLRSNVYFLQSYTRDGQPTMRFVKTAEWGTSWVPEYRCYFEVTKGAGSVITKSAMGCYVPDESDDEATQIDNVVIEVEDSEQHVIEGIYTLNGVKLGTTDVKELPRGIYIVNGKKVVIK